MVCVTSAFRISSGTMVSKVPVEDRQVGQLPWLEASPDGGVEGGQGAVDRVRPQGLGHGNLLFGIPTALGRAVKGLAGHGGVDQILRMDVVSRG